MRSPGSRRREVYRSARIVVDFEMDRRGMAEVARGKELRAAVKTIAVRGKAYAESIAPEATGNYRKSFHINMGQVLVNGMRRVAAILANTDPAAVPIEVGTAPRTKNGTGTPAHRTLRLTLAFLGGRGTPVRLTGPTVGASEARHIPTVEEFRERRRRQLESDRRHRRRRRQRGRGGGN